MESVKKWWSESFMSYAAQIGSNYQKNPQEVISSLKYKSVLDCLNETYQVLVRENCLFPIERLDQKKKNELWLKAKEIGKRKDQCILISRVLYLLESITEK
jgi:hypothetical protein